MLKTLDFATAAVALSAALAAQHPTSKNPRALVLEVGHLHNTATNPIPVVLTVRGAPGTPYSLFADVIRTANTAYGYGTTFPLILESPGLVDITQLITSNPAPVIGNSGEDSWVMPAQTGFPVGYQLDVHAVAYSPFFAVSNGVQRDAFDPAPIGSYSATTPAVASASYIDVEQGDIDGDGDLDVVLVTCGGTVEIYLYDSNPSVDALATAPFQTLVFPNAPATACELIDIDNDGYLDIAFSSSVIGGGFVLNARRQPPAVGTLGPWNGMVGAFVRLPFPGGSTGNDIEGADFDADGDIDLLVGCGAGNGTGQQNRLFCNTGLTAPRYVDVTTLTPLNGILDDTEDVEFYDLESDGDYDIVIGNFAAPQNVLPGVTPNDLVFVQQGVGQLAGPPACSFPQFVPGSNPILLPAIDETMDIALGDVNGDDLADIYVANWLANPFGGGTGARPDVLYTSLATTPITFANSSALLPDAPITGFAAPAAAVDAEMIDYDQDGDDDIFVAHGSKCLGTPGLFGLRLVHTNFTESGGVLTQFFLDPFNYLPVNLPPIDYSDLETGDLQRFWHELDVLGCARTPTPFPTSVPYIELRRN